MKARLVQGSAKDIYGPVEVVSESGAAQSALLFQFHDFYSLFDWGRMPDTLPGKGIALGVVAAHMFEELSDVNSWKDFSRSPEALILRKGISQLGIQESKAVGVAPRSASLSAVFNEVGERLQNHGLSHHYLGVAAKPDLEFSTQLPIASLKKITHAPNVLAVTPVAVVAPAAELVMSQAVMDYLPTRTAVAPRLLPFEMVFRFATTTGKEWDFPQIELFTNLEPIRRPISETEALAISDLTAFELQELVLTTVWLAGYLRNFCRRVGFQLIDGKLLWAMGADGKGLLVNRLGPDSLSLVKDGVFLSKEFLKIFYRRTSWFESVRQAQELAQIQGVVDWRKLVSESAPSLPVAERTLACQWYWVLTNQLCGMRVFTDAWEIGHLLQELRHYQSQPQQMQLDI